MIEVTEFDKETMRLAVETTAQKLSEVLPEWATLIDWDGFDFNSSSDCIEGQLLATHRELVESLAPLYTFGFNVPNEVKHKYPTAHCSYPIELWQFMEAEWRKFKPA